MAFATPFSLQLRHRRPQLTTLRPPLASATASESAATTIPNKVEISRHARDLRGYLRAHKSIFSPGAGFLAQVITLTRKNDTGRMLIPADELETNSHLLPGRAAAEYILENSEKLVETAAEQVIAAIPDVSEEVAEIVRYDLGYVLRVTSYAVAVQATDFVHDNNLAMMQELHLEVNIPAAVFCDAVKKMGDEIATSVGDSATDEITRECFKKISDGLV